MDKKLSKIKYIIILYIIFSVYLNKDVFATVSDEFKFVIDTVGIPQYNVYSEEINEDVYYTYNIFVYSSPNALIGKVVDQRFKEVLNFGKWTLGGGSYKGYGTRGEFNILGRNYSGSSIYNVYFPVDTIPETTPNYWNYIYSPEAASTWQDNSRYKYIDQLEYMKNTPMLFDEIDFANKKTNPYNLLDYGITANKIGLDKAVLNTSSTWKTMGIITAKRKNNLGQIRYAIFATQPMAASADITSRIDCVTSATIASNKDSLVVPIKFGASAINLSKYAKPEHIKEICSMIYINDVLVDEISGGKIVNVDKSIEFTLSRQEYSTPQMYAINIKVLSYLYTEFSVDGLMKDEKEITLNLTVNPKIENPIDQIDISNLSNLEQKWVVSPLVQTMETQDVNSTGIVEAGRYMALKIKIAENTDDISEIKTYINGLQTDSEEIFRGNSYIVLKIKVPDDLENSIKSWKYLRDEKDNYFDANFSEVGQRIKEANELKVCCTNGDDTSILHEKKISFDSIDNYINNLNYNFNDDITNRNQIENKMALDDWINI